MANEVEIVISTSQKGRGFKQVGDDFDRLERKSGKLKGALAGVSKVAGGVLLAELGAGAVDRTLGFFGDATDAASDLNEALSKSNAVFGDQADEVEAFAKSAAKNFGLSRGAALDAAGGFGNMFDQLGIGADVSADMSQSMIELAADFASFNNLETEDVINAQSAALRGEFDSLQRVLPLINAAAVQQKAMAQTGKTNAKELTQQEKAMATYALMVEGAGQAQGDFAKTSDGLANSQKIAEAEMANMREEMGQRLLPVAQKITEIKLEFAKALTEKVIPAIDRGIKILKPFIEQGWQRLQEVMADPQVREAMRLVGEVVVEVMGLISQVVQETVTLIQTIWDRWGEEITTVVTIAWGIIEGVVIGALNIILGVIRTVTALIKGDWSAAWDGVKQILSGAWTAIKAIISGGLESAKETIRVAWEVIKGLFGGGADGARAKVSEQLDKIPGLILDLIPKIARAAAGMFSSIPDAFGGVTSKVKDMWNRLTFQGKSATVTPVIASGGRSFNNAGISSSSGRSFGSSGGSLNRRASGGIGSGLTLVGEHGAELVDIGAGGRVMSNPDSQRQIASAAGGAGSGMSVVVNVAGSVLSERDLVAVIRDELLTGGLADAFTGE